MSLLRPASPSLPPSGAASEAPTRRLGKYELRNCLGQGAMGVVHEAFDPVIGRLVALKTLRPQAAGADAAAVQAFSRRFLVEARAAGRLSHPNIVAVFDYGEDAGRPFIVMERVRGRPLSASLLPGRPQALADVLRWALPLLDALGAAHRAGVVHRDVKPDNVFLDGDGQVKLGDFGVAALDGEAGVAGTPVYAAPEQLRGEPAGATADLYAVGVLLYQALTGTRPFDGPLVDVLRRVAGEAPAAPSSRLPPGFPPLAPAVDRLLLRALAKSPAHRFADAPAFARALARAAGALASGPRPREAGLAQARAEALVRDARAALDAAQYLFADGTLLVDGDAAAQCCLGLARRLDEAAALLAGWQAPAADPGPRAARMGADAGVNAITDGEWDTDAIAVAVDAARDAAAQQRRMADRLAVAAAAAREEATGRLDRLDERLAVLEAYARRDEDAARVTDADPDADREAILDANPDANVAADPDADPPAKGVATANANAAAALSRRLRALAAATAQCAAALQRLEAAWRLPPAWRARAAAAGLRITALQARLRAGDAALSRPARCRASAPAGGG